MTVMVVPSTLEACEQVIERGLRSYVEAGLALAQIRDSRLYRERYTTFEEYCSERWGMSRPRAYQLITAAEQAREMSTVVDAPMPRNERQTRELTGLPVESAAAVMQEASNRTDGKPTAAAVRDARADIIDPDTGEILDPQDRTGWSPEDHLDQDDRDAIDDEIAEQVAEPRVTGLDGKSYPKPTPAKPVERRRPLGDGFRDAALDLGKVVGRWQRLVADDRFPSNKEKVARYANDLLRARDALQRVIDSMA